MPPYHVQDFLGYALWLESLIGDSGGYLDHGPHLEARFLVDAVGQVIGLEVPQQRLRFHDNTFLEFDILIDEGLDPVEYSFHFQHDPEPFVWRKDMHRGHEREAGGLTHIHDNPGDPDSLRAFQVVEMDEALGQVRDYQARSKPFGRRRRTGD